MPMRPPSRFAERHPVALALGAEQAVRRKPQILEGDLGGVGGVLAHLLLDPRHRVAGGVGGDDEGADPLAAGAGVGDREDHRDLGVLARGDELLDAVEHVVAAVAHRPGAQVGGVRSGLGLAEAERAEPFAARHRLEKPLLLGVGGEIVDAQAGQALNADDGRAGAVAGGDLLDGQRVGDVIGAGAVPCLGDQHAHQPELAHLPDRRRRKGRGAAPLRGVGGEPFAGEIPRHVADHRLFFGQSHRPPPPRAAHPPAKRKKTGGVTIGYIAHTFPKPNRKIMAPTNTDLPSTNYHSLRGVVFFALRSPLSALL